MTITLLQALALIGGVLTVMTAFGGAIGLYVHLTVRAELATFLVQLNGTYLRSKEYEQKRDDTERRLVGLENRP